MFFINFYATIAPFLIRTRVKYPEICKVITLKFLDQIFLNLAQYFRMDERTIVPIKQISPFFNVTPVHP
jgi:hypothetical protein